MYSPGVIVSLKINPGGLALFIANVRVVSWPLIDIGKSYNKFCSNFRALRRTLFPHETY